MSRPRWIPIALVLAVAAVAVAGFALAPEIVRMTQQSGPASGASQGAAAGQSSVQQSDDPAVQAQLDYVLAYWSDYNLDDYGMLDGNDCVNFTSQSLLERGWQMDEDWWTEGTGTDFDYSSPWVSSTAFRDYLDESGRATALSDEQRDQVKLGDVVQFDWDNSGDRDHTGVVTRIDTAGDDVTIYFAGHTDDSDYRSVDDAITVDHPGGTAYYWSIPE
ncbi:putative amidase-like protein [Microterricola gilva]|uniref:Putative amidase-like protein n=1 Tax=Microterricola gilva TaxID=393267 RepID=A0A4Q8ARC3_9MICO|nr:amidase domain-containing protein [Microterricola gilva]RZU66781.1 putative amidase-like protein [Microterricola gilva]